MKTDEIPTKSPQPWEPESDPVTLAVVGKTVEEMGEALAKLGRCIIQGLDGLDPVTGQPQNRAELADEIADVFATGALLVERLSLPGGPMAERQQRKMAFLGEWLDELEPKSDPEPLVAYVWKHTLDDRVRHVATPRICCESRMGEAHRQDCDERIVGTIHPFDMSKGIKPWHDLPPDVDPGIYERLRTFTDAPPRDDIDPKIFDLLRGFIGAPPVGRFANPREEIYPGGPIFPAFVYKGERVALGKEDIDDLGFAVSDRAREFIRSLGMEPAVRPPPYRPTNKAGARR